MGTHKTGSATIKVDESLDMMVEKAIRNTLPTFRAEIEKEMKALEAEAKNQWLVREKNSRGSKNKFKVEIVSSQGKIIGRVINTAEYAWAIKVGKKSNSRLSAGVRLADSVLWKPMKKTSDKLTKALIDDLMKLQD
jgi:hypothetical protein